MHKLYAYYIINNFSDIKINTTYIITTDTKRLLQLELRYIDRYEKLTSKINIHVCRWRVWG